MMCFREFPGSPKCFQKEEQQTELKGLVPVNQYNFKVKIKSHPLRYCISLVTKLITLGDAYE